MFGRCIPISYAGPSVRRGSIRPVNPRPMERPLSTQPRRWRRSPRRAGIHPLQTLNDTPEPACVYLVRTRVFHLLRPKYQNVNCALSAPTGAETVWPAAMVAARFRDLPYQCIWPNPAATTRATALARSCDGLIALKRATAALAAATVRCAGSRNSAARRCWPRTAASSWRLPAAWLGRRCSVYDVV
jgi:hypothetical protein